MGSKIVGHIAPKARKPALDEGLAVLGIALFIAEERGLLVGKTSKTAREVLDSIASYSVEGQRAVLGHIVASVTGPIIHPIR